MAEEQGNELLYIRYNQLFVNMLIFNYLHIFAQVDICYFYV